MVYRLNNKWIDSPVLSGCTSNKYSLGEILRETYLITLANIQFFSSDVIVMVKTIFFDFRDPNGEFFKFRLNFNKKR